jgi:hypothetical protein
VSLSEVKGGLLREERQVAPLGHPGGKNRGILVRDTGQQMRGG